MEIRATLVEKRKVTFGRGRVALTYFNLRFWIDDYGTGELRLKKVPPELCECLQLQTTYWLELPA